jgi:hypothetical protein
MNFKKVLSIDSLKIFCIIGSLLITSIPVGAEGLQNSVLKDTITYNGELRIYVVEPISRWTNFNGEPYHFGFLDFAFNDMLQIEYQDTYSNSITWDGNQVGFGDIEEDNILVIAALFNPEINKGYSYPPFKSPFEAHYVDATVAAIPSEISANTVTDNFTHTIFVEEATAQYCPYCPAMANALYTLYQSENYPFYFVALITKDIQGNVINPVALDYLVSEYNLAAYPSAYFDGGYKTLIGGYDDPGLFSSKINASGQLNVHEVDLSLSVEWLGNGELKINIEITNNEEFFNQPPGLPEITGPTSGKIDVEQSYQITAQDPDGNDLYYYIDWGDGSEIGLIGPYSSGRTAIAKHNWTEKESYTIKVKSRDVYNATSDWTSLEISMPKQYFSFSYVLPFREGYLKRIMNVISSVRSI